MGFSEVYSVKFTGLARIVPTVAKQKNILIPFSPRICAGPIMQGAVAAEDLGSAVLRPGRRAYLTRTPEPKLRVREAAVHCRSACWV